METYSISNEDGNTAFLAVEKCLDALDRSWNKTQSPHDLANFLPDNEAIRRIVLIELIKIDLEYRHNVWNFPKRLDSYFKEFPELEKHPPTDLIYEEIHIRHKCGLSVDRQDYFEYFPQQSAVLDNLFRTEERYTSSRIIDKSGEHLPDQITAGTRIDDFDLLTALGQGTFAKVFLARQRAMQRLVALKITREQGLEAQTLARLDHPSIVRVFDQRFDLQSNLCLLYMQYIPGGTLKDVIKITGQMPFSEKNGRILLDSVRVKMQEKGETPNLEFNGEHFLLDSNWTNTVCWIGARLAQGLDYAHAQGVLHRDIKPANVLLGAGALPKLADFNLSHCKNLMTALPKAYFGGSLSYMSPEQMEVCQPNSPRSADQLDGRSDIFSVGVLLWELLSGNRPFPDESTSLGWAKMLTVMHWKRVHTRPSGEPEQNSARRLVGILRKCLAANPEHRWVSAQALADRLELCRNSQAYSLLFPEPKGFIKFLYSHPVLLLGLAAAIPHISAGVFNYIYNESQIIAHLPAVSQSMFFKIQAVINGIAYPLGFGIFFYLIAPTLSTYRKYGDECRDLVKGESNNLKRCLFMGHHAAILGLTLWTLAAIAYPTSLHITAGAMPMANYPHFFGSLLICGLIGVTYPFFGITAIAIRILYPSLINGNLSLLDRNTLTTLQQRLLPLYLLLAALVPMTATLVLVLMDSGARFALTLFSLTGVIGFALIHLLYRRIQNDLGALIEASSLSSIAYSN